MEPFDPNGTESSHPTELLARKEPTMRWIPVTLLLLVSVVVHADEATDDPTARLTIPNDFPLGVTTPVPATLRGSDPGGNVFRLTGTKPDSEPLTAQRQSGTRILWLFLTVDDPSLRGRTLRFEARKADDDPVVTIQPKEGGLLFVDDGRPVLFHQREPKSHEEKHTRANYLHPLYGPDGEIMTQDFPADHPHHRGVFWAWHQLTVGDRKAGDSWEAKDFLSVVKQAEVIDSGPIFATLKLTVDWTSPRITDEAGAPTPFVEEVTTIRLFRLVDDVQCVDVEIAMTPLLPNVRIGGAESPRGYSGFTVRVKPPAEQAITSADGSLAQDAVGIVTPWADVSGRFGSGDDVSGVGILSHRSQPDFPPRWLLRNYGMQNVAFPGRYPIALSAETPLTLRHRLVLHRGNAEQAKIAERQTIYESTPIDPPAGQAPQSRFALRWKDNFLSIGADHLPGKELKVMYLEAYCRPGSTDRVWGKTVIGHTTSLISADPDGRRLRLLCRLKDGVVVTHDIRAVGDGVEFHLAATNPTGKPSLAYWAQPCIRVDRFTGGNQKTYLDKCFVFLDGELSRMPTPHWAKTARYVPGQVWRPKYVDSNDVNPRPLSDDIPSNGMIGCFSADEKMIMASVWEPYQELFQGVIVCVHSDFRIGGLQPGETKRIRGKIYLVDADVDGLLKRYRHDFPEHFAK